MSCLLAAVASTSCRQHDPHQINRFDRREVEQPDLVVTLRHVSEETGVEVDPELVHVELSRAYQGAWSPWGPEHVTLSSVLAQGQTATLPRFAPSSGHDSSRYTYTLEIISFLNETIETKFFTISGNTIRGPAWAGKRKTASILADGTVELTVPVELDGNIMWDLGHLMNDNDGGIAMLDSKDQIRMGRWVLAKLLDLQAKGMDQRELAPFYRHWDAIVSQRKEPLPVWKGWVPE